MSPIVVRNWEVFGLLRSVQRKTLAILPARIWAKPGEEYWVRESMIRDTVEAKWSPTVCMEDVYCHRIPRHRFVSREFSIPSNRVPKNLHRMRVKVLDKLPWDVVPAMFREDILPEYSGEFGLDGHLEVGAYRVAARLLLGQLFPEPMPFRIETSWMVEPMSAPGLLSAGAMVLEVTHINFDSENHAARAPFGNSGWRGDEYVDLTRDPYSAPPPEPLVFTFAQPEAPT